MKQLSSSAIKTIIHLFNFGFIAIIVVQLIKTAFYALPNDWLFFLTSDAIENLVCALIAFGLYYYVLQLNGIWKKIGFAMLFIALLLSLALLKDFRIHDTVEFEQTFEYVTSFLGQSLLCYSGIYFINRLAFLNRFKKIEKELNLAKEQLLRNQLHPHFLFNAFNSLYSLSLKDSSETSEYILKLSSMMRYLTDEIQLESVPLTKELGFINKYIAIEKMRFGNDASIQFTTEGTITDEQTIAPFLLITLIENAFKHGFYTNNKDAFVKVYLKIEHNELLFSVENSVFVKQHFEENNRTGTGINNLRQRLQLLYPNQFSLETNKTKNKYIAELNIILN